MAKGQEVIEGIKQIKVDKDNVNFKKSQIIKSDRYTLIQKDLLKVILDNEKEYSISEVDKLIEITSKKGVR